MYGKRESIQVSWFAKDSTWIVPFLLVTATFLSCEAEEDAAISDGDIIDRVVALGFDRETIVVNENVIVIDGDMIMYRDKLLDGEYNFESQAELSDGQVYKGYIHSGIVNSTNIGTAKLMWATGGQAPDLTMKNAFISAAGDYNSIRQAGGSNLYLSQNNPGPATITVHMYPEGDWPPAGCDDNAAGCAALPSNGAPGAHIYMKRHDFATNCYDWSTEALANRARHELGHAYGFAHPRTSGSTRITGTSACTTTPITNCPENPGYSTVMKKTLVVVQGPCTGSPTVLQTDDRASVRAVY